MKSRSEDTAMVKRFIRPILIGACIGAVCCLLALLLFAGILAAADIPKSVITPLAVAAAAFGAFIGGIVSARMAREKGLLLGAACGLVLFFLILAAGFAVLKDIRGTYAVIKLLILTACGAVGGVLGVNVRKR